METVRIAHEPYGILKLIKREWWVTQQTVAIVRDIKVPGYVFEYRRSRWFVHRLPHNQKRWLVSNYTLGYSVPIASVGYGARHTAIVEAVHFIDELGAEGLEYWGRVRSRRRRSLGLPETLLVLENEMAARR